MHRKASKTAMTRENMTNVPPETSLVLIRPMRSHDAAHVTELIKELGYQRTFLEVVEWIESVSARSEEQSAFVACAGDAVVGWIELSIERRIQSAPYTLIGGLVVKDGFRRQGIGLRLCEEAESWSWDHGVAVVRVTSRSTRLGAHRFYERNGYHLTKLSHVFEKERPSEGSK